MKEKVEFCSACNGRGFRTGTKGSAETAYTTSARVCVICQGRGLLVVTSGTFEEFKEYCKTL